MIITNQNNSSGYGARFKIGIQSIVYLAVDFGGGTLDLCDCGIEARNRYRVYAIPRDSRHVNVDGLRQVAYIREESDCFQRQMCGPNRKLTLIVETEVSGQTEIEGHCCDEIVRASIVMTMKLTSGNFYSKMAKR